jgi:hypothetical protein
MLVDGVVRREMRMDGVVKGQISMDGVMVECKVNGVLFNGNSNRIKELFELLALFEINRVIS